jgi:hypothetical protein
MPADPPPLAPSERAVLPDAGWFTYAPAIPIVAGVGSLFTGRYSRALFNFVQGVVRWPNGVVAHAFVLVIDHHPPFGLRP